MPGSWRKEKGTRLPRREKGHTGKYVYTWPSWNGNGVYVMRDVYVIWQSFCLKKNLKQSWLPAFWKKRTQNTHEIKRTLFDWTKRDKTWKFSRKSFFSSYVQQRNRRGKKHNKFSLSCVRWMREAGRRKRARDSRVVHSLKKKTSSKICTFCPVSCN